MSILTNSTATWSPFSWALLLALPLLWPLIVTVSVGLLTRGRGRVISGTT